MGVVRRTVEVDAQLLGALEASGGRLERIVEDALVRRLGDDHDGRARAWAEENAEAIAFHNARIEAEGVFGEEWRPW